MLIVGRSLIYIAASSEEEDTIVERYPSDKTINKGKKDCSLFFSLSFIVSWRENIYKEIIERKKKERLVFVSPGAFCRIQLEMG